MKRLTIACSLITATTFLLVSGGRPGKKTDNSTVPAHVETQKTTRLVQQPSGVSYEILQPGSGAQIVKGNQITVHYTGWVDNNGQPGVQFDTSYSHKKPFTVLFGFGLVMKGWDDGVQNMQVGEKRRVYIPSQLAYGAHGAAKVPPYSNIIFDIELLSIASNAGE